MTNFFRFPHTPHIAWLGEESPRDDKVLPRNSALTMLSGDVVVEEKVDGANLGISVGADGTLRAQNRGQYLHEPHVGQFAQLGPWMTRHENSLFEALGEHLIAFGEWCAAQHSLEYQTLPDWWLLFDIYDRRAERFWSTRRREAWAASIGLSEVPILHRGRTDMAQLLSWVATDNSNFRDGGVEGLVIRHEDEDWLLERAKLVRADFAQAITTHWRSRAIKWNRLRSRGEKQAV